MKCKYCGGEVFEERMRGIHLGLYCSQCNRLYKFIQQNKPINPDMIWPIGKKHKGEKLSDILKNDREYLVWFSNNSEMKLAKKVKLFLNGIQ